MPTHPPSAQSTTQKFRKSPASGERREADEAKEKASCSFLLERPALRLGQATVHSPATCREPEVITSVACEFRSLSPRIPTLPFFLAGVGRFPLGLPLSRNQVQWRNAFFERPGDLISVKST